jgi:hypothetical protein
MMRWYLLLILCFVLIGANGCTRIDAAPAGPPPTEVSSEQLTEYVVVSMDGTVIGPVDGVVIGTETGATQYVVVFLEDIYNFGKGAAHEPQDHFLVIPWTHLKLDAAKQLVADADAAFINEAPLLTEPPEPAVAGWDSAIEVYWAK